MSKNVPADKPRYAAICGYAALPYLLTGGFVLAVLAGDALSIPPLATLLKTMGFALAGVFMVHLFAIAALRKTPVRELMVCGVVAYLGLFGYVHLRLQDFLPGAQFLAVWTVFFAALLWLLWQWREEAWLAQAAAFIGFASLALVGMQAFQIGGAQLHDRKRLAAAALPSAPQTSNADKTSSEDLPDIYYIVLDAYASSAVLAALYGYDNREFLDALRERGFFIAEQSRANYHLTELSLASSLNMTHLAPEKLGAFRTRAPLRRMIQNNAVARFLDRQGYATVAFASGKADTECRGFDHFVSPVAALNVYQDVLLHTTAVPQIVELTPRWATRPADWHRRRVVQTLESIPEAGGRASAPSFVFAHVMSPHAPFVFDADGRAVDWHGQYLVADGPAFLTCHGGDRGLYRRAYAAQLQHLNQLLISMIDRILARSEREAVIILQGDHGPRSEMDFEDPHDTNLAEAFGILNAIRLPGGGRGAMYSSISPVNTFRVVLNDCFAMDLSLQADRSYFETAPYQFDDVTDAAAAKAAAAAPLATLAP